MIKKAASKAFIICGGLMLLAMISSTVWAIVAGGLEGKDLFAAPLLVFYISIFCFIVIYPVVFLGFMLHAKIKK